MVSFNCFRDGKCEWNKGLKDFAAQFNEIYSKDYSLSKCLDISGHKKQPEILLESSGNKRMVIECKKIVYPENYYQQHRHIHEFFNYFKIGFEADLKSTLPQDFYVLHINEITLYQYPKRELERLAQEIIFYIKNNVDKFLTTEMISIEDPIHCCFRFDVNTENEWNNILDKTKAELRLYYERTWEYGKELEAEKVIAEQLDKYSNNTKEKFKQYTDCIKIFILEICGISVYIPQPKAIIEIIKNSAIPQIADQIWLAVPDDESENIITYHRVV
ncbi:MAG: hypothetical protein ACKPEO_22185 [Sphaerospermopsis kisseleviana]